MKVISMSAITCSIAMFVALSIYTHGYGVNQVLHVRYSPIITLHNVERRIIKASQYLKVTPCPSVIPIPTMRISKMVGATTDNGQAPPHRA